MKQLKGDPVITSLIGRRRFDEARQAIGNLLHENSDDIIALYYLAMCEYLENNFDKAKTTLRSILRKNDQFLPAQNLLDHIRLADSRQSVLQQVKPAKTAPRERGTASKPSLERIIDRVKEAVSYWNLVDKKIIEDDIPLATYGTESEVDVDCLYMGIIDAAYSLHLMWGLDDDDAFEGEYRNLAHQGRDFTVRSLATLIDRHLVKDQIDDAGLDDDGGFEEKPSTVFRDVDAPWCPEMVALKAGPFRMGSWEDEEERRSNEGPQHWVNIGYPFALGRYPITVNEYRRFVKTTGHSHAGGLWIWDGSSWKEDASKDWRDPGFQQTERHPVVGVNWRDARAYIDWLRGETGKPYRLPSEAEWEYAARAGTTTRYAFGDAITPEDANYGNVGKTTEVGSYPPNAWDLYDMHGNVWEWVQDIYHDSYKGAPSDGSTWTDGEGRGSSRYRVVRGGSWGNNPWDLRSAYRDWNYPDGRNNVLGFRVARTLD